jgi:V-type H+-transporting ATPase subunit F
MIRPAIAAHTNAIPTVLEIPSKEHPYDEAKDPLMARVKQLLGNPED